MRCSLIVIAKWMPNPMGWHNTMIYIEKLTKDGVEQNTLAGKNRPLKSMKSDIRF